MCRNFSEATLHGPEFRASASGFRLEGFGFRVCV